MWSINKYFASSHNSSYSFTVKDTVVFSPYFASSHNETESVCNMWSVVFSPYFASSHNNGSGRNRSGWLFLVRILHQVTTRILLPISEEVLFLVRILHQVTTNHFMPPLFSGCF